MKTKTRKLSNKQIELSLQNLLKFASISIKEYDAEAEKLKVLNQTGIDEAKFDTWCKECKDYYNAIDNQNSDVKNDIGGMYDC